MTDPFYDEAAGPVFHAVPAVRAAVPALISLWGYSSSGKTYSALRLARGMVGMTGQIALIDTENGRAKSYAEKFGGAQGPWLHIDMQPPFTPERYVAAHRTAIDAGADAIIIDSASHVWAGEGGVIDQAESKNTQGLNKWRTPKLAYTRMNNTFFRSPVHTIFCLRAKNKNLQIGKGKDAEIVNIGDVPICDPAMALVYESLIVCHMQSGVIGSGDVESPQYTPIAPVKAPEDIADVIQPGQFITEEMGAKIASWLAGGEPVDHETLAHQQKARQIAADGTAAFRAYWGDLAKEDRARINSIRAELQQIAQQADDGMARDAEDAPVEEPGGDPLADPYTQAAE